MEDLQINGPQPALTESITAADPRYNEWVETLCRRNEQLSRENKRLEEVDALRTSLIGCISHELRTPLSHIMGYGSILQEGVVGNLNSDQESLLIKMMESSEQLLRIIGDLLIFSKIENGRFELQKAPVDLMPILEEIATRMNSLLEANDLILKLDLQPLPIVEVDTDRIRQILYNLLENAAKFTPKNGWITFSSRQVPDGILLEISDTGIGINPEHQERIFDRFYQVPNGAARQKRGAGLGLSIVKDLVEAHGGEISCHSIPGQGATFAVFLPL